MNYSRFVKIFLLALFSTVALSLLVWKFYFKQQTTSIGADYFIESSCSYENIDLDMPIAAFLKRCVNSPALSMVKRLVINQWIYSIQIDLAKLVVYVQGVTTFEELKKMLEIAMKKEGEKNTAISMVQGALKIIEADEDLIENVNDLLLRSMTQEMHMLRGNMMGTDEDSKEYKKIKAEYQKTLEHWIDENYGPVLDIIIART